MNFLYELWNFEYSLVPCLTALLVFEFPILYRRFTRKVYVPIYFSFFPFGFSDELYAKYFDDHEYWMIGEPLSKVQRTFVRQKIIWLCVLSLTLTMTISPFLAALFSHFFLDTAEFRQFIWTLAIVKAVLLSTSLLDLRWKYLITDKIPLRYIAIVYFVYWVLVLFFLKEMKVWIDKQMTAGGWSALRDSTIDFLVLDIGVGVLFVAVVGWLVPWRLTAEYKSGEHETEQK